MLPHLLLLHPLFAVSTQLTQNTHISLSEPAAAQFGARFNTPTRPSKLIDSARGNPSRGSNVHAFHAYRPSPLSPCCRVEAHLHPPPRLAEASLGGHTSRRAGCFLSPLSSALAHKPPLATALRDGGGAPRSAGPLKLQHTAGKPGPTVCQGTQR